jgi:hypothetical protein
VGCPTANIFLFHLELRVEKAQPDVPVREDVADCPSRGLLEQAHSRRSFQESASGHGFLDLLVHQQTKWADDRDQRSAGAALDMFEDGQTGENALKCQVRIRHRDSIHQKFEQV